MLVEPCQVMSPYNPATWHMHPLALEYASTPEAWATILAGVVLVWLVVSWWTDWRYGYPWRRRK